MNENQATQNFCAQCGSPLREGVGFCPKCGAKVQPTPAAQQQPVYAQPVQQYAQQQPVYAPPVQQPVYAQPAPRYAQQMYNAAPQSTGRRNLIAVIILLAAAVTLRIIAFALGFESYQYYFESFENCTEFSDYIYNISNILNPFLILGVVLCLILYIILVYNKGKGSTLLIKIGYTILAVGFLLDVLQFLGRIQYGFDGYNTYGILWRIANISCFIILSVAVVFLFLNKWNKPIMIISAAVLILEAFFAVLDWAEFIIWFIENEAENYPSEILPQIYQGYISGVIEYCCVLALGVGLLLFAIMHRPNPRAQKNIYR